jgi:hypothetical protein
MSHYTVLVIGDKPEAQLAPYHEFECTGLNDQYVQDVDITREVRKQVNAGKTLLEALEYFGLNGKVVEDESRLERDGKHMYGYAIVTSGGELTKAVDRTNPNAKWDWYQLGGRYAGRLKLKEGASGIKGTLSLLAKEDDQPPAGYVDQATKGAIDFEGMRNEKEHRGRERHRRFHALIKDLPYPESWETVMNKHPQDDAGLKAARDEYHAQPAVKAIKGVDEFFWDNDPFAVYKGTEDEYAAYCRAHAITTFAVVKDSQWYEQGKMGWWAMVENEKSDADWTTEFNKLLDTVPDDTLLSMYDCHI